MTVLNMTVLSLRLPKSLHRRLRVLAREEGSSINQLINSAVAEKLAAMMTETYLRERALRGRKGTFDDVLSRVPARSGPIRPGGSPGPES